MNPVTGVLVYVLIWWVVLFAVLPFGVRGQWEEGDVAEGSEPGAPRRANIGRKALATTAIAAVIWGVIYLVIRYGVIDFASTPS